jgi:hypothetical protein
MIGWITHLQHTRAKDVFFDGILDEKLDDFNRNVFVPQSSGTGRLPSACFKIPNICVSLNRLVFIVNLLVHLAEKILILNPINARGDYRLN